MLTESLNLCTKMAVSGVLTRSGATLKKMVRFQLHRLHFSDVTKDVVVAASVCYSSKLVLEALLAAYIQTHRNWKIV